MSTVRVADGPLIRSSRCDSPTRKNWNLPEWSPACIFSWTAPAEVRGRPIARSVRRISNAARAARPRVIVALVQEQQRIAPELEEAASLRVCDRQKGGEGCIHDLGDLFGSGATLARELLGHRRES